MAISREQIMTAVAAIGVDIAFLVETGSRAYGTDLPGSDTDLIGFYFESERQTYGLQRAPRLKHRVRSSAPLDEQGRVLESVVKRFPDGTVLQRCGAGERDDRALPDDVEVLLLPLREYAALAAAGNPEFFGPLHTALDGSLCLVADERARSLVPRLRESTLSKHAVFRIAGYARSQRDVVTGDKKRRTNRHDLVAKHGYDTKAGSHMLRLLIVGHRLVTTGAVDLPMPPEEAEEVMRVRRGEVPLDALLTTCDQLERLLVERAEQCSLPDEADMLSIDLDLCTAATARMLSSTFQEGASAQLDELISYDYHPQATGLHNPYEPLP